MVHLLIRGIGLCGATGELECTLEPDDATCPACRELISMFREKECGADATMQISSARIPLERIQLGPAIHYFAGGAAFCRATGTGRWTIMVDSVTCAACTEKLSGAAADLAYTHRLLDRYTDLCGEGAVGEETLQDLPVPRLASSWFARVCAWTRRRLTS